ncbi:hypothetical protein FAGAP_8593 [Fusarium agapanthi]|uniref:Uncharacterized protein n=1 Tax=Fusarium agapanthi TaxID=1803897 RepID=A0A9P5B4R3_9HYPO|nr:hypothetical protein FAGAP_8593 [Fusarium agapanthi]
MSQTLEESMQQLKKQLIQNQLDSLYISIANLVESIGSVPADIISRSCLAIMKSLSSLAYGCVMESIGRYDESELQHRCEEIRALTCPFSDDDKDDSKNDLKAMRTFHNPHLKDQLRNEPPDVKANSLLEILEERYVMTVELCLTPYEYSDVFVEQARFIRASLVEELKYHWQSPSAISSEGDDVLFATLPLLAQPLNAHYERWIKKQVADHERYLRLPVNDDVVLVTLHTYKSCRNLEIPSPQGLTLHALSSLGPGEQWQVQEVEISSGPSSYGPRTTIETITMTRAELQAYYEGAEYLKKEVPATHPSLGILDLDFDKEIPQEYGIVIAWRFVGGEAWMDRYGHLIPQDSFLCAGLLYRSSQ